MTNGKSKITEQDRSQDIIIKAGFLLHKNAELADLRKGSHRDVITDLGRGTPTLKTKQGGLFALFLAAAGTILSCAQSLYLCDLDLVCNAGEINVCTAPIRFSLLLVLAVIV